jgi:ABC-type metal ion transport system substrate-binding protein
LLLEYSSSVPAQEERMIQFIRVGITYGPEQEIAEVAKKVAKENITWKWNLFLSMIM